MAKSDFDENVIIFGWRRALARACGFPVGRYIGA